MAREGKDSLMFSLFNMGKNNKSEEPLDAIPVVPAQPAAKKEPVKFIDTLLWTEFKFNEQDARFDNLRLHIDSQHLYAKMRRVFVEPDLPISAEEIEKAQKFIDDSANEDAADKSMLAQAKELLASAQKAAEKEEYDRLNPVPEWDIEFLQNALAIAKIKYGILQESLEKLLNEPFNTDYIVAQGTLAIDGKDESIKDYFSRESGPKFETRADGSIDFKNMHLVTNIEKGGVICEIVPGDPGVAGINIHEIALPPRAGSAKILPRGENTEVDSSQEADRLIATVSGNLVFKNDRFNVENVYKVNGNVDNGVGNINFSGDVIVTGDVLEGYEIRTPKSIKIFGMVEGASLFAGEDIHLEKGINGMSKGTLEAGGVITAKFIENCSVRSGKDIASESIINSKVESDANIKVTGKGLISGGKCVAFGSIEARTVGSRASAATMITLGITSSILREKNEIDKQLKEIISELFEIKKNTAYLEQTLEQSKQPSKLESAKKLLSAQAGKTTILTLKKQRYEKRKEEIADEIRNVTSCTLTCNDIFPPSRITIGNATLVIKESASNCRFYRNSDGEISMGMK